MQLRAKSVKSREKPSFLSKRDWASANSAEVSKKQMMTWMRWEEIESHPGMTTGNVGQDCNACHGNVLYIYLYMTICRFPAKRGGGGYY